MKTKFLQAEQFSLSGYVIIIFYDKVSFHFLVWTMKFY